MKKLMLGTLVLLPIIVLLVVGLVTAFITNSVRISVESVTVSPHSVTLEIGEYELDDLFSVTVKPTAAEAVCEWAIKDVRSRDENFTDEDNGVGGVYFAELLDADDNHVDTVTTGGRLRVTVHCSFTLEVSAETITDSCRVVVGGDVSSVRIEGVESIGVGESARLSAVVTPLDGVATDFEWKSSDESVLRVDRNGILTGVAEGSADVTLSVINSAGQKVVSAPLAVTVNAALTPYGNTLDIGAGSFGLSAIGLRGSEVRSVDGGTLNGDEFTFDSGSEIASLALANGTVTLRRCAETAIEIVESDALDGYILEMGGLPLYLSARYRSVLRRNETPKVSWGSSSDDVVSVDADGTVRGLMSGTASVTAQSAEGESASVDITVQRTVAVLVLKTTQSSLEAGIGRETVFPSMRYDGTGKLTDNEFAVEVAYPSIAENEDEEAFYEAFEFTTDRPDLARFNTASQDGVYNNTLLFDSAALAEATAQSADGRVSIRVSVRAKYPRYAGIESYTSASFVITVVNGVAVSDEAELRQALSTDNVNAVLTDDVHFTLPEGAESLTPVSVNADLYGNGHTVSAPLNSLPGTTGLFNVSVSEIVFSNLTIRPNEFNADSEEIGLDDVSVFTGYAFRVNGTGDNPVENFRLEYSLLENASSILNIRAAEVTVDGSVLRNTAGPALYVASRSGSTYADITVNNCVFSNMAGMAISFDYQDSNYRESAATRSVFRQTGFMDVYNWQSVDNLQLLPRSEILKLVGGSEAMADLVISTIQNMVTNEEELEPFRRKVNGVDHVHLGFFSIGLSAPSYINYGYDGEGRLVNREGYVCTVGSDGKITVTDTRLETLDGVSWNMTMEDTRYNYFTSANLKGIDSILSLIQIDNPLYFFCYDDNVTDLVPGSEYTINTRLIARLHGEGV